MASVQGIYLALFGRPADPAGLAYFNGITNNGANLAAIGNLSGQQEYISRFTGMTNEQIVTAVYQSLFGRDPEKAGLDFYVGQLASGKMSINNIAINILDGAAGDDKLVVDAKIAAANLFTTHLDLPVEIAAYSGNTAAQLVRTYINSINLTKPGTAADVDALIQALLASGGQAPGGSDGGGGGGGGGTVTPPADEKVYSGDVLLLNNDLTLKTYQYSDFKYGIQEAVAEVAEAATQEYTDAKLLPNVVLINNMTPINLLIGEQLAMVTGVVEQIPGLKTYNEWQPDSLFLNVFNKQSSITGTVGNDIVLVLDQTGNDQNVTGGRGNDIIIVADASGFSLPGLNSDDSTAAASAPSSPVTVKHTIDGGADEDIIINIGGTDNVLSGGSGNDIIVSIGDARDTINGGDGDDFIFSGANGLPKPSNEESGDSVEKVMAFEKTEYRFNTDFANGDVLDGGAGKDTFIYLPEGESGSMPFIPVLGNVTSNGADTIKGFKTGEDKIALLATETITIDPKDYMGTAGKGGTGYTDFDAAASDAQSWLTSVTQPPAVAVLDEPSSPAMKFVLTANVADGDARDSYLFIDNDANGSFDFVIKLAGLTSVGQFNVTDIQSINVDLLGTFLKSSNIDGLG